MAAITIKNIPADLYELVKKSAAANRRSINREIITFIESGVRSRRVNPEALLNRARVLRQKTKRHHMSDKEFKSAKLAGRP